MMALAQFGRDLVLVGANQWLRKHRMSIRMVFYAANEFGSISFCQVFYFLDQSIVLNGENVHQSVLKPKTTSSNVSTQRYSVYTQSRKGTRKYELLESWNQTFRLFLPKTFTQTD